MAINYAYFMAIVEEGGLTKAAEKLFVSQPSLSQYLKRLEKSLGVELFDHSSSPLRLTYAGQRYYQHISQIARMDENIRREIQDIKQQNGGRLRLGVALWRGACLLPDIYPYFHGKYPEVKFELTEGRSAQLERALMNDEIDVAVINLPFTVDYSKLTCEIVRDEQILIAAPTTNPYVEQVLNRCSYSGNFPIVSLDLVSHIPLIMTKPGQNLTYEILHVLNQNLIEPDILLETANLSTAINLTAKGMGCTFVPEEGARVCNRPGEVTYFVVEKPKISWPLAAVYRRDIYVTRLTRLFIDALKNILNPETVFFGD